MTRYYSYDALAAGDLHDGPCAVCGGHDERELGLDNGFRVVKCRRPGCGFVYVNPRPSRAQLRTLYARYYPESPAAARMWEREMATIFRECRDLLVARRSDGAVLDVGCSYGHLLRALEAAGWRVTGVEPSARAAEHARALVRGRILTAEFEDVALPSASFDAVVALYVLEHVSDPRAFLAKVHDLLRAGGVALLRVPYTEPLMPLHRLLGRPLLQAPMHLNDFSPEALRRLALDLGFREVRSRVGALRRSHDRLERIGASVLGGSGRLLEALTGGRVVCPYAGALSYVLER